MSSAGSAVDYGRKLVNEGLAGARNGSEQFLKGRRIGVVLTNSAEGAVCPAALGAMLGALGGLIGQPRKSTARALFFGMAGCAIGFGAGVAWQNRKLAANAAQGAAENIGRVRQEHWMERNSIAYA
jgi:hypothetical protein